VQLSVNSTPLHTVVSASAGTVRRVESESPGVARAPVGRAGIRSAQGSTPSRRGCRAGTARAQNEHET